MKNYYYMLVPVLLAGFFGCNLSAEESKGSVKSKGEIVESATIDSDWVRALDKATPLSQQELLELLPKTLHGLPKVSSGSGEHDSVEAMYSNDKKPSIRSKSVSIEIADGAGKIGLEHMVTYHNVLNSDVSQTFKNTWAKTTSYKGMRVMVKQRASKARGSIPAMVDATVEFIKDNRYFIILQGNDMDSETLLKAVDEVQAIVFPK